MKNLNLNTATGLVEVSNPETQSLEFNEVMVYQEMADQPAVRLNLMQQIQMQMSQLDEMVSRKQFVLKEVFDEIVK